MAEKMKQRIALDVMKGMQVERDRRTSITSKLLFSALPAYIIS